MKNHSLHEFCISHPSSTSLFLFILTQYSLHVVLKFITSFSSMKKSQYQHSVIDASCILCYSHCKKEGYCDTSYLEAFVWQEEKISWQSGALWSHSVLASVCPCLCLLHCHNTGSWNGPMESPATSTLLSSNPKDSWHLIISISIQY